MSLDSELIFGCVHMFASTFGAEHTQGTMPSSFFRNFQKKTDNYVETDRTSERFFDGNSISRK
jgi:hypothetical protein